MTISRTERDEVGRISAPCVTLKDVTPHSADDLPDGVCKALYVGTGGDLVVVAENDASSVTLKNVPDGTWIPVRVRAVRSSGNADDIIAGY